MELLDVFAFGFFSFLAGYLSGGEFAFRIWRRNADEIQRIEWRGRLYKVEHAG